MRGGDSDRTLEYDAENRLRVIEDTHNGTMSLYTYNSTIWERMESNSVM